LLNDLSDSLINVNIDYCFTSKSPSQFSERGLCFYILINNIPNSPGIAKWGE